MDQVAREVDFDTILQSAADGRYYIYISEELVCENFMPGYQMCETPATEGRICPQLTIRRLAAQCILRVVLLLVSESVQSTHNLGGSNLVKTKHTGFFFGSKLYFTSPSSLDSISDPRSDIRDTLILFVAGLARDCLRLTF